MCIGYMQILHLVIQESWAPAVYGMKKQPATSCIWLLRDTELHGEFVWYSFFKNYFFSR